MARYQGNVARVTPSTHRSPLVDQQNAVHPKTYTIACVGGECVGLRELGHHKTRPTGGEPIHQTQTRGAAITPIVVDGRINTSNVWRTNERFIPEIFRCDSTGGWSESIGVFLAIVGFRLRIRCNCERRFIDGEGTIHQCGRAVVGGGKTRNSGCDHIRTGCRSGNGRTGVSDCSWGDG